MAGIGEASAIIAVISLGFTLSTTLTTYVADVRDGQDEIASLANDLKGTAILMQELARLLTEDLSTHGWSAGGRFLARKCFMDCALSW